MRKTTGRILRAEDIKVEGVFHLGSMRSNADGPREAVVHSSEPKVSVIETNSEFTIIEITCPCGTKTSVKCDYASSEGENRSQKSEVRN